MLKEQLQRQGAFLFRWRGILPILFLFLFIPALLDTTVHPFIKAGWSILCEFLSVFASFLGLFVRCFTQGFASPKTSGRARRMKAQSLNTEGMYSCVRHPLYLGNFLIFLGFCLFTGNPWLVLSSSVLFFLFLERVIAAEEAFLEERFGEKFLVWARSTPTLLPNLKRWKRPNVPFSFKRAIRKEYHTAFLVATVFAGLDSLRTLLRSGDFLPRPFFRTMFLLCLLLYVIVRLLSKKTTVLKG